MRQRIKGEYLFLVYSLVFGILLVFLTPPFAVPDETAHYINAYSVSRGTFFGEVADGQLIRKIPSNVIDFETRYSRRFAWAYEAKMDYQDIVSEIRNKEEATETVNNGGVVSSPTGYLVSGLGMAVGSFISHSSQPYYQLLFGRFANLLFYSFVTFFALRIIPCFKRTLLLVAMMPMTLFLGASLNYDAVLIPVTFLFVAIVARMIWRREDKIQPKEITAVLFCTFFLVGIKQAYAPLLLMLLAVPRKKYGSVRNLVFCIAAVVAVAMISCVPQFIHNRIASAAVKDVSSDAVAAQAEWISGHLSELPGVFLNTLKVQGSGYLESFWGILGVLDTPFPKPMVTAGLLIIVITGAMEICSCPFYKRGEWWKRLMPLAAIMIIVAGMMYVMYREWTPLPAVANTIGGDLVEGIQGRYFIPLAMPLCFVFANSFLSVIEKRRKTEADNGLLTNNKLDCLAWFWSFACGLFTVLFILLRYWI